MLLFIAVIATLNLCLGYLLGVHMCSRFGCTHRPAPEGHGLDQPHSALGDPPLSDLDDFAPYSPPDLHSQYGEASAESSLPAVRQDDFALELTAELPQSHDLDEIDPDDPPAAVSRDASESDDTDPMAHAMAGAETPRDEPLDASGNRAAEVGLDTEYGSPPNVASLAAADAPAATAEAAEHDTIHNTNLDDYMAGLAAFESQLSHVDQRLRSAADSVAVERCATEMTTASNRYVVQARQACDRLNRDEADSSLMAEERLHLKQSINDQTRMVMGHSENIRGIDAQGDMGEARDSLLELSTDLATAAAQLRSDLVDIIARAAKSHDALAVESGHL